jgi:hypothetical protein
MASSSSSRIRRIQVLLSDSQNARLKKAAQRSGVTASAFIRVALERELALEKELAQECARKPSPSRSDDRKFPVSLQPQLF